MGKDQVKRGEKLANRVPPHYKAMSSYMMHAWHDACSIAQFIDDTFTDLSRVRKIYEDCDVATLKKMEEHQADFIAEFIGKTEGQRPGYFNRISRSSDEETKVIFLVLCLVAVLRTRDLIDARDTYRGALAPGGGNRETLKGLYKFGREVVALVNYDWPSEPFEAIGLDDDAGNDDARDEDDQDDGVPDLAAIAEEPTPQRPEVRYRELVVQHTQSKRYAIAPDGRIARKKADEDNGMWSLVGEDLVDQKVLLASIPNKLDRATAARRCAQLLRYAVPDHSTILVGNKTLVDTCAVDPAIKDRVVLAKTGVGQRAFVHWIDDYLDDLQRELALINEPMPTPDEFVRSMTVECGIPVLLAADPIEGDLTERRIRLAQLAGRLCAIRGRDLSECLSSLETPRSTGNQVDYDPRQLSKERQKLARYAATSGLTDIGQMLLTVFDALEDWRQNPEELPRVLDVIGNTIVSFACGMETRGQRPGLWTALSSGTGRGSTECDVMMRAVFQRLSQPMPAPWVRLPLHFQAEFGRQPTGFYSAYWIDAIIDKSAGGEGALRSLPYHQNLCSLMTNSLDGGAGLKIAVARDFFDRNRFQSNTGWIDGWGWRWESAIETFLAVVRERETNRPRGALHRPDIQPGRKMILLQVYAPTLDAFDSLRNQAKKVGAALQEGIDQSIAKAQFHDKVEVASELQSFSAPYIEGDRRLAAMFDTMSRA